VLGWVYKGYVEFSLDYGVLCGILLYRSLTLEQLEMSKEYIVNVVQYGFAIVEADSAEEAKAQIEDNSNDLCWSKDIEITSVDEHE